MSVTETIKNIYTGPFKQYLNFSEKIGGAVHEQSKLVDVLFLLEINLISIIHKYKKPIYEHEQNIFIQPILIQLRMIRRMKENHQSSPYFLHLTLVDETVNIFEWTNKSNIEDFIQQIKNNVTPYLTKLKNELLKLDTKHIHWLHFWNAWLDGMSKYFIDFYKDGLSWVGTEELPTYLLGDISVIYRKMDRLKLFQEINQGENIIRILRQSQLNNDEAEEEM